MAVWERLKAGLRRTRDGVFGPFESAFQAHGRLDEGALASLEELLLGADLGVQAAEQVVEELRASLGQGDHSWSEVQSALESALASLLVGAEATPGLPASPPGVLMFVGVNGSGKTTTVAKVARLWREEGRKVLLAAADTFRAAAIDQLARLGEQVGVEVVRHRPGADPGAVVHDALEHARSKGYDAVLVDTAGRLQTKRPLMEELGKVRRVVEKLYGRPPDERVLVVDATVGQNAISQAQLFDQAVQLSGLVVTKLDGTAKGGAVIPIWNALNIPIYWIGVGEGQQDLQPFRAQEFARALVRR
ncbi:MAG: signal recognition particle-docking protein FtsY [Candidatus Bipolaricaulaceae bacterium]